MRNNHERTWSYQESRQTVHTFILIFREGDVENDPPSTFYLGCLNYWLCLQFSYITVFYFYPFYDEYVTKTGWPRKLAIAGCYLSVRAMFGLVRISSADLPFLAWPWAHTRPAPTRIISVFNIQNFHVYPMPSMPREHLTPDPECIPPSNTGISQLSRFAYSHAERGRHPLDVAV